MTDIIATATTHQNVEMKTLVNSNFFVLMHEVEEHISYGWRIHPDYSPVANFTFYEVVLRKDLASIKRVQERIEGVLEARGESVKEKLSENIAKAQKVRKQNVAVRKVEAAESAQAMLASLDGGKNGD